MLKKGSGPVSNCLNGIRNGIYPHKNVVPTTLRISEAYGLPRFAWKTAVKFVDVWSRACVHNMHCVADNLQHTHNHPFNIYIPGEPTWISYPSIFSSSCSESTQVLLNSIPLCCPQHHLCLFASSSLYNFWSITGIFTLHMLKLWATIETNHWHLQEAQLPQRDHATCYVSWNLVKCCTILRKLHFKMRITLKATQGHWNCHYSVCHIALPISNL